MKKIEKGAEGEISPSTISNLLSTKLNHDIILYVIVPFLFSTCRKCSTLLMEEELKDGRCPDCLISVCLWCDTRGTESDFHKGRLYLLPFNREKSFWYCENEIHFRNSRKHRQKLCNCAEILSNDKKLKNINRRREANRERLEAFESRRKARKIVEGFKNGILATPIIYLAGKAMYSNLLGKRKR